MCSPFYRYILNHNERSEKWLSDIPALVLFSYCLGNFSYECSTNADANSRKVFEALIDDEERHFDQYDNEMENIDKFGEKYLALQSFERSKTLAGGV